MAILQVFFILSLFALSESFEILRLAARLADA